MRLSPKTLALNAGVITALVGGTTAYASLDNTVTLAVDGKTETVSSFGSTVGDVLESEGIELGEHDVVAPSVSSPIEDGSEISVRYGRLLTVSVDGVDREVWTTALSVDEALAELGIRANSAELSVSRSAGIGRSGLDLEVVTPKELTFVADGKSRDVTVTALTVRDALAEAEIAVGKDDRVTPAANKELEDGDKVVVERIERKRDRATTSVAPKTVKRETSSLYKGQTRVKTEGESGRRERLLLRTYVDGENTFTRVLSDEVVRRPVTEVVLVGTKRRPASSSGSGSSSGSSAPAVASGSVWDRLAQCESGGNWSINTGNGYSGGLQFSAGTWAAYGGSGLPHQNSREEQIRIASKVRDARGGYGDWPACSAKLGLPR